MANRGLSEGKLGEECGLSTSVLTLRLFGTLDARIGEAALPGLRLREGERLLAYLAVHHGVSHSYRDLARLFWPSEAQQNEEFEGGDYPATRQAIFSLRRALGDHAWRLKSMGKGIVSFDVTDADIDVVEFTSLVQADDTAGWRRAVELHHAPLLETWTDAWVREARTRLLRSYERVRTHRDVQAPSPASASAPSKPMPSPALSEAARQARIGGAVALASPFYIERSTDMVFHQALAWRESIVLLKGARQIGKTSLLARGLQQARQAGGHVLLTDFQSLDESSFASSDALYRTLAQEMADQLDLQTLPEETWHPRRSAGRNLERYLCDVALGPNDSTLIWGLDVVDRLFGYPCGSEAFSLFRSWHNRRALDPAGPWSRLTLAIAYATEAHLFIADQNQSPFNVGVRLTLSDFQPEQVAELNRRYGSPLTTAADLARFYELVGGHPYLVRCGLAGIAAEHLSIAELESLGLQEQGPFGDHLHRLRLTLQQSPELTEMMRKVLRNEPDDAIESFYRLRSAGLITGDIGSDARPRCRLYSAYLSRHLL